MSGRAVGTAIVFAAAVVVAALVAAALPDTVTANEAGATQRAPTYILSINPLNSTQSVNTSLQHKSATYTFTVKNIGDTGLPGCDLQLSPWAVSSEDWSYVFVPSCPFEVNPGDTKNAMLIIYPAHDAEAKRYTYQIKGKTGIPANSISINLDILAWAGVNVEAPQAKSGIPGDNLQFDFRIINSGNCKDRFLVLSVEVSVPGMVPSLTDPNNWTGDIAPGKSVVKSVMVQIPYGQKTTSGQWPIQLSMTVSCGSDSGITAVNFTCIHVEQVYDFLLDVEPYGVRLSPGETGTFTVTVLNLGNGADSISLTVAYSFDASKWTVKPDADNFNLTPDKTGTTAVRVAVPTDAPAGQGYSIHITARSSGPAAPGLPVERTQSVAVTVNRVTGIRVPAGPIRAPSPARPGEVVRFEFNVTNTGNSDDTVSFTVANPPGGWLAVTDWAPNTRIGAGTTLTVRFTVQVSISFNESVAGKYTLLMAVANSDQTANHAILFEIDVARMSSWELHSELSAARVNPLKGGNAAFTFTVSNTGNTPVTVSLVLSGQSAQWSTLDRREVFLDYGTSDGVRVEFGLPPGAGTGREYTLTVQAFATSPEDQRRELQFTVWVVCVDLAVVPAGNLEINGQVGPVHRVNFSEPVGVSILVRNEGTEMVGNSGVELFDNGVFVERKNTTAIGPGKAVRVDFRYETSVCGTHNLSVSVDPGNQLGESRMDNNDGGAVVDVKPAAGGNGGHISTGDFPSFLMAVGVVVMGLAGVSVSVLWRHNHSPDRELYESIYGTGNGHTPDSHGDAEPNPGKRKAQI